MYESFLAAIPTEWINVFFHQSLGHFWHHASYKLNYEDRNVLLVLGLHEIGKKKKKESYLDFLQYTVSRKSDPFTFQ